MTLSIVRSEQPERQVKSPWALYLRGRHICEQAVNITMLSSGHLYGPSRACEYSGPRQVVMLALRNAGLSYPQIAKLTSRADHTTAMHGVKNAKHLIVKYPDLRELLDQLEAVQ